MTDWIKVARRTINMLTCERWQDIVDRYGLYREEERYGVR